MRTVLLLAAIVAATTMQNAVAAKRLGPPIEELQSTPERVRIVVGEAMEKFGSGGIRFAVREALTGEAPGEVQLRTDRDSFTDVVVGESYLLAWTYMRRNRGVVGGWEEDPEGPSTVTVMGLGSTALFEATPEMRFLFAPGTIADKGLATRQIDAMLLQLQRDDPRSRGLVIAELYLREDLTAQVSQAQARTLADIVQSEALTPQHRDLLLRASLRVTPGFTRPWLGEELRKTIIQSGTQYDLSSYVPSLVRTAARGLRQVGEPADVELLSTLLYANNPGVSKAALEAMDQLDREAAIAKARQAVERGWIHGETRLAISRYLAGKAS